MITSIAFFTITWIIAYFLVWVFFRRKNVYTVNVLYSYPGCNQNRSKSKIGLLGISLVSLCFVLYNYYITSTSVQMIDDRYNYYLNFIGFRSSPSIGLSFIISIVRFLGGNFCCLLLLTTFICFVVTLIAYDMYKVSTPGCLLLLFLSQYQFGTYVNLKQCYASALACLFFAFALKEEKAYDVWALIIAFVAALFHSTGYILFPLIIVLRIRNRKLLIPSILLFLAIALFSLKPLALMASRAISGLIPMLSSKINQYFIEMEPLSMRGVGISFLKGLPYYVIPIMGLYLRRRLNSCIDGYDILLIIAILGAYTSLLSIYNVWFGRFLYLFMLPMFVLFGAIANHFRYHNRIVLWCLMGFMIAVITYRYLVLVYINYGGF